jgi:hypothetical protein
MGLRLSGAGPIICSGMESAACGTGEPNTNEAADSYIHVLYTFFASHQTRCEYRIPTKRVTFTLDVGT